MTTNTATGTTYQLNIFTGEPEVAGDVVARIRYLLQNYRDARNDYMAVIARYWVKFDQLDDVVSYADGQTFEEAFLDWMQNRATSPKTLQNRTMEIQSAHPELDADPHVRARRRQQAKQGPVR